MPIEWLMRHWEAKAELTLPFLTGRAVGMQLKFGDKVIFRRHVRGGGFIRVESREELLKWARQHCYSFHPHLEDDVFCFALDIDRRTDEMPFALAQLAAAEMAAELDELGWQYLLKFSGHRGFHCFWGFEREELRETAGDDVWGFTRGIIRFLRQRLEERLQAHRRRGEFEAVLGPGQPFTVTNSADREHARSLLLDENIVHDKGSLRSPWSVHPESGLVALPLTPDELGAFRPEDAEPAKVLERGGPDALPLNRASDLARELPQP